MKIFKLFFAVLFLSNSPVEASAHESPSAEERNFILGAIGETKSQERHPDSVRVPTTRGTRKSRKSRRWSQPFSRKEKNLQAYLKKCWVQGGTKEFQEAYKTHGLSLFQRASSLNPRHKWTQKIQSALLEKAFSLSSSQKDALWGLANHKIALKGLRQAPSFWFHLLLGLETKYRAEEESPRQTTEE